MVFQVLCECVLPMIFYLYVQVQLYFSMRKLIERYRLDAEEILARGSTRKRISYPLKKSDMETLLKVVSPMWDLRTSKLGRWVSILMPMLELVLLFI